jgi:hypothetical protein
MGSKPKSVKAPKVDYSKDIGGLLTAFQQSMPGILSFEQQYRPEFQGQNLADVSQFGLGMLGLSPQFTQGAAEQLGAARGSELGQMTSQAGLTRGLMEGLSPEQAAQVKRQVLKGLMLDAWARHLECTESDRKNLRLPFKQQNKTPRWLTRWLKKPMLVVARSLHRNSVRRNKRHGRLHNRLDDLVVMPQLQQRSKIVRLHLLDEGRRHHRLGSKRLSSVRISQIFAFKSSKVCLANALLAHKPQQKCNRLDLGNCRTLRKCGWVFEA